MAGHRNWHEVSAEIDADPERRARVNEIKQHLEWEHEGQLMDREEQLMKLAYNGVMAWVRQEGECQCHWCLARAVLDAVLPAYDAMREEVIQKMSDAVMTWTGEGADSLAEWLLDASGLMRRVGKEGGS